MKVTAEIVIQNIMSLKRSKLNGLDKSLHKKRKNKKNVMKNVSCNSVINSRARERPDNTAFFVLGKERFLSHNAKTNGMIATPRIRFA